MSGVDRCLVNRTYLGLDPYFRPGNYISHVLIGLPTSMTAHDAVLYWGSESWFRGIDGVRPGYELNEVAPASLKTGPLISADFARTKRALRYLIAAFVSRRDEQQILIAAPPDVVAELITGLTAALPGSVLADFTFSTYERDPLRCRATVVGTCPAPMDAVERFRLPDGYQNHVWLDAYRNTHCDVRLVPGAELFAAFAVACLCGERWSPDGARVARGEIGGAPERIWSVDDLRDCLDAADESSDGRVDRFLALAKSFVLDGLTPLAIVGMLHKDGLARLERPAVRKALLAFVGEQQHELWWLDTMRPLLGSLTRRERGDNRESERSGLKRLAHEAARAAVDAATSGDRYKSACMLELVVLTDALRAAACWQGMVSASVAGWRGEPRELTAWVLESAAQAGISTKAPEVRARMPNSAAECLDLLSRPTRLPVEWRRDILLRCLRAGQFDKVIDANMLASSHAPLLIESLALLGRDQADQARARQLVRALICSQPESQLSILRRIHDISGPAGDQTAWRDQLLGVVLDAPELDWQVGVAFLEDYLELIGKVQTKGVKRIVDRYLNALADDPVGVRRAEPLLRRISQCSWLPEFEKRSKEEILFARLCKHDIQPPDKWTDPDWDRVRRIIRGMPVATRSALAGQSLIRLCRRCTKATSVSALVDAFAPKSETVLRAAVWERAIEGILTSERPSEECIALAAGRLGALNPSVRRELGFDGRAGRLGEFIEDVRTFGVVFENFSRQLTGAEYYEFMEDLLDSHAMRGERANPAIFDYVIAKTSGLLAPHQLALTVHERAIELKKDALRGTDGSLRGRIGSVFSMRGRAKRAEMQDGGIGPGGTGDRRR
jgi:hypothetical protein